MDERTKELLESFAKQLEKLVIDIRQRAESEAEFYTAIMNVVKEILEGKRPLEDIIHICCYGNLGYCCGLEKDCPFRNLVLEVLGIDKDEYKELKELFGKLLIDPEKRKKLKEVFSSI